MDYGNKNANELMPPALAAALPNLYATENTPDPTVHAKYFTPDGSATWLITEFDGGDLLFGFAYLGAHMADCAELGYMSLEELRGVRGKLGLRIERDLFFKPKSLSVAMREEFGL